MFSAVSLYVKSDICRLFVTHLTQANEIFGNVSTTFGTFAIC